MFLWSPNAPFWNRFLGSSWWWWWWCFSLRSNFKGNVKITFAATVILCVCEKNLYFGQIDACTYVFTSYNSTCVCICILHRGNSICTHMYTQEQIKTANNFLSHTSLFVVAAQQTNCTLSHFSFSPPHYLLTYYGKWSLNMCAVPFSPHPMFSLPRSLLRTVQALPELQNFSQCKSHNSNGFMCIYIFYSWNIFWGPPSSYFFLDCFTLSWPSFYCFPLNFFYLLSVLCWSFCSLDPVFLFLGLLSHFDEVQLIVTSWKQVYER